MSDAKQKLTGQCHCGEIKYEAVNNIIKCSYCKCRGCQRSSGALDVPYVTVSAKDFTITAGTPAEFRASCGDSCDAHGTWLYCPKCGGRLCWKSNNGEQMDICAGSLDDTSVFSVK